VNSFGDLISSITVGLLWSHVSYTAGLAYGASLTLIGALLLFLWHPAPQGEPVGHESH
jgi:fucose permease